MNFDYISTLSRTDNMSFVDRFDGNSPDKLCHTRSVAYSKGVFRGRGHAPPQSKKFLLCLSIA